MNDNTTNYRRGMIIAISLNVVLAIALVTFWWHSHRAVTTRAMQSRSSPMPIDSGSQATPSSATDTVTGAAESSSPEYNEVSLAPVQLTPQRMQSIGVKLGTVEIKRVSNEIRVPGNVEVDERRLAYVQLRFPGWIH